MSLKHTVLGCISKFPAHGYDMLRNIFKDFLEQRPEVNKGQLYTLLQRMEKEGLIERELVPQDKAPNRKLIKITPRGEKEFYRWLRSDEGETEFIRFDFFHRYGFLYKVNHFNKLSPEEKLAKIDRQIAQMEEKLANFLAAEAEMIEQRSDPYHVSILQFGIENQKMKIAWLKKLRKVVTAEIDETPSQGR